MADRLSNYGRADLIEPTSDENFPHRLKILTNLEQVPADDPEIRLLLHFLQEEDWLLYFRATSALQKRLDVAKSFLADLMALLDHPRDRVKMNVLQVLCEMGPDAAPALPKLQAMEQRWEFLAKTMWKISGRTDLIVGMLVELAQKPSEELCDLIYEIGPDAAAVVPSLKKALQSTDADLRWAAVGAFESLRERAEEAIPELIHCLGDGSGLVAGGAARALATIGVKAVPALIAVLKAPNNRSKEFAADALAQIGEPANAASAQLESLLTDPNQDVAWWSAIAHGRIAKSRTALPVLKQIVESASIEFVRARAREAISDIESHLGGGGLDK